MTRRVLFVCLGNICRSPMAEGLFKHEVKLAGREEAYTVSSAGMAYWAAGQPPDMRTRAVAQRHGIRLAGRARQFRGNDFDAFDLIVAMDRENRAHLMRMARNEGDRKKVRLMREFDPLAEGDLDVPDPYEEGPEAFERVYAMLERSARRLLETLEGQ